MGGNANATALRWLTRARCWLDALRSPTGLRASSAEGRYHAVFGRDSLWSGLLALDAADLRPGDEDLRAWALELTGDILLALARLQGTRVCDENEEQPGKIVHEYWPEPPRHLLEQAWPLVDGRYYGSADATLLFLIAGTRLWHAGPVGRERIADLWPALRAALEWTLAHAAVDGDGLVWVSALQPARRGLINQVWKDSHDSVQLPDGGAPEPPVAWVEPQAYALAALRGMAELLAWHGGEHALRAEVTARISSVETGLARFWLVEEQCPALALTRERRRIPMIASNVGHVLWCDALSPAQAGTTAARLMKRDMLSDWGIRTLSSGNYAFDPGSYHRGSIWPFDNAIAASALWRMGRWSEARELGSRVLSALEVFDSPVELYCALPAAWVRAPACVADVLYEYGGATRVQAWSAAGVLVFAAQLLAEVGGS